MAANMHTLTDNERRAIGTIVQVGVTHLERFMPTSRGSSPCSARLQRISSRPQKIVITS